jgi:hypothetical protein
MSFVGMKNRRRANNGLRTHNARANRPQPTTPIRITSATAAGSVLTVVFDQAVALSGVPQYTTDVVGATALSAVSTSPTTIEITFSAAIAAATAMNIPYEEPAVRNSSGGFVADSTFPV